MKTLKIAIVAFSLLIPFGQASAGNPLRDRLLQAQQVRNQDFRLIQQESQLFRANMLRLPPALKAQSPDKPALCLADLSLPGKEIADALIETRPARPDSTKKTFGYMINLEFPPIFASPAPAAK